MNGHTWGQAWKWETKENVHKQFFHFVSQLFSFIREDFLFLSFLFSFKLWAPVGFRRQADSGFSIAEPSVLRVKSINFTDLGMFIAFQKWMVKCYDFLTRCTNLCDLRSLPINFDRVNPQKESHGWGSQLVFGWSAPHLSSWNRLWLKTGSPARPEKAWGSMAHLPGMSVGRFSGD